MKSRSQRSTTPSSLCTFLKPGALAQMRYSKIAAKSKAKYARTLISLSQMKPISSNLSSGLDSGVNGFVGMEEIPGFLGFKNRYQPPRCFVRKKMVAARPVFNES